MSDTEYTPTMEQLRIAWWMYTGNPADNEGESDLGFEDAMQAHDRQVAAKALTEYADALEENRHAWLWDKTTFVSDIRDWAEMLTVLVACVEAARAAVEADGQATA